MKKITILILSIFLLYNKSFSQNENYLAARNLANAYSSSGNIRYDSKRNIYISNDKTIHIFLFEDGNLLLGGYPTTATEIDKFQVHLFVSNSNTKDYLFEYSGVYAPILNIEYQGSNGNLLTAKIAGKSIDIRRIDFAVLGPFTHNLVLTLKSRLGRADFQVLTTTTIQLSKIIHVSIGSGILFTSLKNPALRTRHHKIIYLNIN